MTRVISLTRHRKLRTTPSVRSEDIFQSFDFSSAYQPIFSPTHQKLVGFEALVRVTRDHHPVSPAELFSRADTSQQTVELDSFLLHRHLEQFSGHSMPVWLFLNINPETCIHPASSLDRLVELCRACGIAPDRIVLELVETASNDPGALLKFIHMAKTKGFRVAIDDFGVEDSNFDRLWRMDPMIVKLDRSLVFCVDLHPDELFSGQLCFPQTL